MGNQVSIPSACAPSRHFDNLNIPQFFRFLFSLQYIVKFNIHCKCSGLNINEISYRYEGWRGGHNPLPSDNAKVLVLKTVASGIYLHIATGLRSIFTFISIDTPIL